METIIYQGQPIEATLVNYISGRVTTSTVDCEGDEELFRDEGGCYYLRRKLTELDSEGERREASRRTLIHRVNVNAAILWATTRLNSNTLDLRCDAAALLMEGHGYTDPHPSHLSAEQRAMVSDPERFAKQREAEAGSGRITVELDDLASAMLRKVCKEGDACRHAGENLRDLVNAAVTFFLCDDRNDQQGEFDLSCADEALERAKHDRLKLETTTPQTPPAIAGESKAVEIQPGVHRFTFDYPATERFCGMQRTVDLGKFQMDRARELAAIFGLDLPAFVKRLVHNNTLPGQPRAGRPDDKLRKLLQAEHVGFVCTDAALAKRIERAAQSCGQSVEEFVAYSLGGDVDMWEECMLLHPTTGDLLDTDYEDLYCTVEEKMTVAPIGREDEPPFSPSMGKERVNFGVYLRPDQLERLEYPHVVWSEAEDREVPCVLIPLDLEGSPYLSVGKQEIKLGEPIPQLEAVHSDQRPAEQKGAA